MSTVPSLSENTAPDGTDVIYSTDGTNDEKVQIKNLLKGSGAEVPAAKITGTVAHEQGGLEADVSAYSGLVKITGGATSAVADPNATVTTKGDLLVRGASALGRVAIGTNDQVLTADSAEASGVKWADVDSGTIAHERGGLEADVSAYSGLVKITGGATSAVAAPTGAIVGTTDTQALTNKTISTASNTITIAGADVGSGTIAHERGGLEADVSAYSGLVKITGGATSAVTAPTGAIVGTTDAQTLSNKTLDDYAIEFSAIGNTGSTQTFDLETANAFSATLDQASAFTFSNPPATGNFGSFVLELTNGDAYAITWPASVDWAGGSAPTLTSSGVDILAFVTRDGGTIWHGYVMSTDSK